MGMDQKVASACGLADLHVLSYFSTNVFSLQQIVVEQPKLWKRHWGLGEIPLPGALSMAIPLLQGLQQQAETKG